MIYPDRKGSFLNIKVYWKRKAYYFTASTMAMARKKENELKIQLEVAKRKGTIPEFVIIKAQEKSLGTPVAPTHDKQSLAALFDLYEKYSALRINPRSLEVFQSSRKSFECMYPNLKYKDVNVQMVENWKYKLQVKEGRKSGGVRRYMAAMASCFSYLKENNHIPQNPFAHKNVMRVKGITEPKPYLLKEEVSHLMEIAMQHEVENLEWLKLDNGILYPDFGITFLVALGCYAGLRPGESIKAKWGWLQKDPSKDYTGDFNCIFLPNMQNQTLKSYRSRQVSLHQELEKFIGDIAHYLAMENVKLTYLKDKDTDSVVPTFRETQKLLHNTHFIKPNKLDDNKNGSRYDYRKTLKAVLKKAGLESVNRYGQDQPVTAHVFRHTFCSLLAQSGVSGVEIRDLAGHASLTTTDTYLHLQPRKEKLTF